MLRLLELRRLLLLLLLVQLDCQSRPTLCTAFSGQIITVHPRE